MSRYHRASDALPPPERWFHGTSAPEFGRFRAGIAYLTDDPAEAMGFAEGGHLGGSTGGEPRVMEIRLAPGPVADAADEVDRIVMDEHPDLDDIDGLMARLRGDGYRYADFTHPGFAGGDIRVRVSLHPEEDLAIAPPRNAANPDMERAIESRGTRTDDLLDALDLADDLAKVGAEVSPDGIVTLYHRTDSANAEEIASTGKMLSREDRVFFGTAPDGEQISGHGDATVRVRMPLERLELQALMPDEAFVTVMSRGRPITVDAEVITASNDGSDDVREVFRDGPAGHDADILSMIYAARRKYRKRLEGGNCGQFALALARFLRDSGARPDAQVAMLTDAEAETETELRDGEPDIYHVFLQLGQEYYDGDGKSSKQDMLDFASGEYGDPAPTFWDEFPPDELARAIISYNTDWDIEWTDFYGFLESLRDGEVSARETGADPAEGGVARRAALGDESEIEAIAVDVRRRLGVDHELEEGEAPKALCLEFTRGLVDELVRQGYSAGVTQGTFEVDWPDGEMYDDWDKGDFEPDDSEGEDTIEMSDEEEMEQAMHFPLHYWVRVTAKNGEPIGPIYADITADQFDDESEESFDPVWVWTGEDERHQSQRHDFIGAAFPQASMYHRTHRVIVGDTGRVYHGTSLTQLESIRDSRWQVRGLYLADYREKSEDYAEMQAVSESKDAVPVVLELDMAALRRMGQVEVDSGSGPEEWEQDMGQFIYSGPLMDAITNLDEVIRELRDEWGEEFLP